jgi:type II secretory pathway component GspD/PulD (secretin)
MRNLAIALSAITLAMLSAASIAPAQTPPAAKPATDTTPERPAFDVSRARHCDAETTGSEHTFYLNNAIQGAEANEIVTAMRNVLDACDKVYLLTSQNAIVMRASLENMALAQKLLTDLDRPKKTYRLTYTITEMDGTRRIGAQHFSMVVVSGQETKLKQGSKVPIATGSYSNPASSSANASGSSIQTQYTYIDIGMNFSATLDEFANGVRLRSDVVQSGIADAKPVADILEPVIRQTELIGAAFLTPGRPLMLGSIDIPGTTRHQDLEVVMEQLP